jgi:hypothetical protein
MKYDMVVNLEHFMLGEFSGGRVSWATSIPQRINLASREIQLEVFFGFFVPILSATPIIASNNLVFGEIS